MDDILLYGQSKEEDYYAILGCSELSTVEQISAEYKAQARLCHPDKFPDDCEAASKFQRLQHAKDVLCNEESRKDYDRWRHSGICITYTNWRSLSAHHSSMHWAPSKKQDSMIEESPSTRPAKSLVAQNANIETRSDKLEWQRERYSSNSESVLSRFRKYEI